MSINHVVESTGLEGGLLSVEVHVTLNYERICGKFSTADFSH